MIDDNLSLKWHMIYKAENSFHTSKYEGKLDVQSNYYTRIAMAKCKG